MIKNSVDCIDIVSDWRKLTNLQVLLLDEVTVDLDVVARMDLLDFFKEECEQVDIIYYRQVISCFLLGVLSRITIVMVQILIVGLSSLNIVY